MRRVVCAAAVFILGAAPARANPVPLARVDGSAKVALAGDQALFTRVRDREVAVYSIPLAGGTPRRVFAYTAPRGTTPHPELAASAQRAAVLIDSSRGEGGDGGTQAFTGVPGAPWTPLGPFTGYFRGTNVVGVQVEGDRVIAKEFRGGYDNLGVTVHEPQPVDVFFYSPTDAAYATFAGDLVAYSTLAPGDKPEEPWGGRHVIVRDWRTRTELAATDFPELMRPLALEPGGTVLASGQEALYRWTPGSPPAVVAETDREGTFAGDRVLFEDGAHISLVEPGGAKRAFGVPSSTTRAFTADAQRVLWIANGCLLVADAADTSYEPIGPGPCARTELGWELGASQKIKRTLSITLICVAAPGNCTGTARIRGYSRPTRFSIPSGQTRRVQVRLSAEQQRRLRKRTGPRGDWYPPVSARTDDGSRLYPGSVIRVHVRR